MKILLALMFLSSVINAFQPIQIIDKPTAGMLNKKVLLIDVRNYAPNALMFDLRYAPFSRFQFGISYGATNIIGDSSIVFNKAKIGLKAKFRILEEGIYNPALVIGVNTQGYGKIVEDYYGYKKFLYGSDGGYLTLSKSFMFWLFSIGVHGTVNYEFEREEWPSFFEGLNYSMAVDFGLFSNLFLLTEYDFRVGDLDYYREKESSTGLWNVGLRVNILSNFSLSFHIKDMLGLNEELHYPGTSFDRELRLSYFNAF